MRTRTTRSRHPSLLRIALAIATAALVSMSIFGAADIAEALPFGAKTDFATGSQPRSVAIADFDGDGKPDLVLANNLGNTVSILLGTGTGSFGAKTDFATGTGPLSVATGDFDGDGDLDLAAANSNVDTVSILLGTGTGSFGAKTDFATGDNPESVTVGDVDRDGDPDLAVANAGGSTVSVLLGAGTGSFGAKTDFATGSYPESVALGDFDGDGDPDLATANNLGNTVSILLGTGTGSFGAKTDFATGVGPRAVAIGDFDTDGNPDVALTNLTASTVSVLLGTGTGSFGAKTDFATGTSPYSVAVGDFNEDGKPDLAVANLGSDKVSILPGTGTGSFGAKTDFVTGGSPVSVAMGDVNVDGKPDLATANTGAATVSVLLGSGVGSSGTFTAKTDYATGVSPYSAAVGDVNGDGKADLATANLNADTVSVLLGTGTGTFGAKTDFATGGDPFSVAIGDVNRDGNPDLAVANNLDNTVSVLLGTGTGSFGAKTDFGAGNGPYSLRIGDFNGDGNPDLVTANLVGSSVSVLLGTGTGSFGAATNFTTGNGPDFVAIGDLNGDGNSDLATANLNGISVSILLGTGTGSFGAKTDFTTGTQPRSVAISDLNGDGNPDLAVTSGNTATVAVLLGTGTGSFGAKTDFATGAFPHDGAIGDVNGDGKSDLAVANLSDDTVSILLGTGTGSFGAKTDFATGDQPNSVAIGDFNKNGQPDLAVANGGSSTVSVLLQASGATFTVNSSNDVNDGTCNGAHCSLREAIIAANVASNLDTIVFAIGSGAVTIAPTSALPTITQPVIIDATTQPGYVSGAIVEIRGDSAGGGVDGLAVTAGGSTIKGFLINRFGGHGIKLTGAGGNTIKTCNIGRDLTGTVQPNAGDGIFVGTAGNFIGAGITDAEANVISGNLSNGVEISGVGASANIVTNNAIGTNGGLANLDQGNTLDGVLISGAPGNTVHYNVISGNESDGVEISGVTASANIVRGNAIGTDRYGNIDLGNTQHGVRILGAPSNSIGTALVSGYGNLISGNGIDGIRVDGAASTGNTIKGNLIGTNLAGTLAIPNAVSGVGIYNAASPTTVGGTAPSDRNIISGNVNDGVYIGADGNSVLGNYIGTNGAGTAAIGNSLAGIAVVGSGNFIGGTVPGSRNVISGNVGDGISINTGTGTTVQGNYVGTDKNGTGALSNSGRGVIIESSGHTVGGSTAAARNVIANSGGTAGVYLTGAGASSNTVRGNWIGVGQGLFGQGPVPMPNALRGILINIGAAGNTIGGPGAGDGNIVAHNSGPGIQVDGATTTTNRIRGNSIYENSGDGVLLTSSGNGPLAAPVITLVAATIDGTTTCSGCTIDVYSDGASQGRIYQGTTTATGTTWSFTGPISGPNVTATVTDGSGNTSPFSVAVPVDLLREAGKAGTPGFDGDGGLANALVVRLNGPHGLFKHNGNLYFADTNNNRIRTITPNSPLGIIDTIAGSSLTPGFGGDGFAATGAKLHLPNDVAVDSSGNVYIADTGNCRIRRIDVGSGNISTIAGTSTCGYNGEGTATTAQLNHPYGVAVDSSGNVFIADTDNNRIRKITGGTISTIAGTGTAGYGGDGGLATAATLRRPYDIVISVLGTYVIADTDNNAVRTINISTGIIAALAGSGTAGFVGDGGPPQASLLDHPWAVAVDGEGDIYIADTNNNRVRHINHLTNTIQTAVGVGSTGAGDPDAIDAYDAHLDHPAGVAAGSVTVSDTGNHTIRIVQTNNDPTGQPSPPRPGSGNSCSEGPHGVPLAGIGDWSVIMMTVGLIGAHRRIRWLFQLMSALFRQRARGMAT